MRLSAAGLGALALAAVLGFAVPVSAQTPPAPEPSTFQDATGYAWGLTSFELGLAATAAVTVALADECRGFGCIALYGVIVLGTSVAALLGLGVGIGTAIAEAPADVPFVVHNTIAVSGFGFLLGHGIGRAVEAPTTTNNILGLSIGAALGVTMATYTALRADDYVHSEALDAPAHVMFSVPLTTAALTLALLGEAGASPAAIEIAVASAALVLYGATIAWGEACRAAAEPTGTPAPLFGFGAPF